MDRTAPPARPLFAVGAALAVVLTSCGAPESGSPDSLVLADAYELGGYNPVAGYGAAGHTLSDGQLQRACLARALAQNPRYLILDEATAMLDAATTATIIGLVMTRACDNLGVLLISHDEPLLAAACTRIATMREGALTTARASPHSVEPDRVGGRRPLSTSCRCGCVTNP
ncbi:ATP-binding cassette domain-containing protein [Nocardia salmonicida]|uniref:ATP-binding cassette domain-containing protein n=1 Tax=Nocardia salmonicida TaxID=53431 RepID=UPI0036957231